jgi:thioredoxin 1
MTREEFKNELSNNNVVVTRFGAEWCVPCHTIENTLSELAEEFGSDVKFINIDVEDSNEVAQEYKIRNVPTVIYFKNGEAKAKTVGAMSKDLIKDKISDCING